MTREGRQYFHAGTGVMITAEDMEEMAAEGRDSDDNTDEGETERRLARALADRHSITPTEKAFIMLWNSFSRRKPIFSDYVVPRRCLEFVLECLPELQAGGPSMRACLVVHLLLLWEFALVDGAVIDRCLQIFDRPKPQVLLPPRAPSQQPKQQQQQPPKQQQPMPHPPKPPLPPKPPVQQQEQQRQKAEPAQPLHKLSMPQQSEKGGGK